MEQRQQPAHLAETGEFTVTELIRRFGLSRRTVHWWTERSDREGLAARHHAPKNSSEKTAYAIKEIIIAERRRKCMMTSRCVPDVKMPRDPRQLV